MQPSCCLTASLLASRPVGHRTDSCQNSNTYLPCFEYLPLLSVGTQIYYISQLFKFPPIKSSSSSISAISVFPLHGSPTMGIISRWVALRRARASRRTEPEEIPSASSETKVDDKKQISPIQNSYTIEHLPTEIKRLILLALPKLDDLHAIIRASPVFHQVYVLERSYFLRKGLVSTLGDTWIDAYAADASDLDVFYSSRSPEEVKMFLSKYQDVRASRRLQKETLQSLSLEVLVNITAFFTSTVEPLACVYAGWALGDIASTTRQNPLSSNELGRIVRAVYRFQIFCKLFLDSVLSTGLNCFSASTSPGRSKRSSASTVMQLRHTTAFLLMSPRSFPRRGS